MCPHTYPCIELIIIALEINRPNIKVKHISPFFLYCFRHLTIAVRDAYKKKFQGGGNFFLRLLNLHIAINDHPYNATTFC